MIEKAAAMSADSCAQTCPVTFDLVADAGPGVLSRVLMPFARRDLVPNGMRARRHGDALHVSVSADAMPREMLRYVEGNLRQLVGLRRLEVVLRAVVRAA